VKGERGAIEGQIRKWKYRNWKWGIRNKEIGDGDSESEIEKGNGKVEM
jgi:hypothetical protein